MSLTEDGLYEILMQSRKPLANMFKKEVKQELKRFNALKVY
ncbi:BRO family protein [Bacillus thuringiensis]